MANYRARRRRQPPSRQSNSKKVLPAGLIVLLLSPVIVASFFGQTEADPNTVRRVIDGDTIEMGDGQRVRLIGVDTPETKHPNKPVEYFGKEATAFARRMVEGKRVRLEFDPANAHIKHRDRYGRTLAYVFLEDGTMLNAEIIRQGYGFAMTKYPFARMEEFKRLERDARAAKRGLWNNER